VKTRSQSFFADKWIEIYDKNTKVLSLSNSRPNNGSEGFTVLIDTLHGDHKTGNPHEFVKNVTTNHNGWTVNDNVNFTTTVRGVIAPFSNIVSAGGLADWTTLYNTALGRLYDDIRSGGVGSGLDLSVDFAEGRQVGRMIGDVGKLASYVRSFRPKNWANKWLEYQYGWRPLVNSIYDSYQAIMKRRLYGLMKVVGKAKTRIHTDNVFLDGLWQGSKEFVGHQAAYRTKVVCYYRVKNTVAQQLAGYTSLNPVSIAWELTPYSFVVDWLYDIGGYLRCLESALLYQMGFVEGYQVNGYLSLQSSWSQGGGVFSGSTLAGQTSAFCRQSYKKRIPITLYPLPRIPRFESDLGWQRCISGASLMSQHLGKH